MKLTGRIVVILSLALLLLAGCGSSSDDDGSAPPPTQPPSNPQAPATQAGSAADNAIDAIEVAAEGGDDALKSSFAATKAFGAGKALRRNRPSSLVSRLNERFNDMNLRRKAVVLQQITNCSAGGSVEVINDILTDTELRFTVQFDQCREREVVNGTEVELLANGFADLQELLILGSSSLSLEENATYENLTLQTSIVSSGIVLEALFANLAVTDTITINDTTSCGGAFTGSVSQTSNGTINISQDANADGDSSDSGDLNTSLTTTNYVSTGEAIGSTDPNCAVSITEATVTLSGGVSFTDNNNPGESLAISSPSSDPLTVNERVEPELGGISYTIDGTMTVSVDEPCIEESSLTFIFLTTVRIFVPDFAKCPTAGQLMVTLNDTDITVTYTESGGVVVNSGGTEETFDSCDNIDACRDSL